MVNRVLAAVLTAAAGVAVLGAMAELSHPVSCGALALTAAGLKAAAGVYRRRAPNPRVPTDDRRRRNVRLPQPAAGSVLE